LKRHEPVIEPQQDQTDYSQQQQQQQQSHCQSIKWDTITNAATTTTCSRS
jgi:hypothetical protein